MAKATVSNKKTQATTLREVEVMETTSTMNLDSVTRSLTATQVEVQQSLASLSAKLTEQLQVLRSIEDAIALKEEELRRLHNIEAREVELDTMLEKIEATRQGWELEQEQKRRLFAEQQSERNKQWAREKEEYDYKTTIDRRKAEDEFTHRMALQDRNNAEKQSELEKTWAAREMELKKREQELVDLRAKVDNIPEVVKKEVNAAVAISTNSVKKEYETKIQLAAKDAEVSQRLAAQEVESLKASIGKQNTQLEELKAQLEQARSDVKEISAKALESASDRSAMAAIQKVLVEKETPQRGGK